MLRRCGIRGSDLLTVLLRSRLGSWLVMLLRYRCSLACRLAALGRLCGARRFCAVHGFPIAAGRLYGPSRGLGAAGRLYIACGRFRCRNWFASAAGSLCALRGWVSVAADPLCGAGRMLRVGLFRLGYAGCPLVFALDLVAICHCNFFRAFTLGGRIVARLFGSVFVSRDAIGLLNVADSAVGTTIEIRAPARSGLAALQCGPCGS